MSQRPLRRPVLVALLALVPLVLWSCEPGVRAPADPLAPDATVVSGGGDGLTLVEGRIPSSFGDLSASRLIGVDGGTISLLGHTLTVPKGAVKALTLFTMTIPAGGYVAVELTAIQIDLLGRRIDIGARGFGDAEVTLTLSYASATNVSDPSRLLIVYLKDGYAGGRLVPLPSEVDEQRRTVTARLEHFSAYCMATD